MHLHTHGHTSGPVEYALTKEENIANYKQIAIQQNASYVTSSNKNSKLPKYACVWPHSVFVRSSYRYITILTACQENFLLFLALMYTAASQMRMSMLFHLWCQHQTFLTPVLLMIRYHCSKMWATLSLYLTSQRMKIGENTKQMYTVLCTHFTHLSLLQVWCVCICWHGSTLQNEPCRASNGG